MKRRNLIASIGAVVAGGAAIGTGAFTSVEAERTATVAIADENEAQDLFLQTEFEDTKDLDAVGFYVEDAVDNTINDDVAAEIGTGNSAAIGVSFDTDGIDVERGEGNRALREFDATITATDEEPDGVDTVVDEDGDVDNGNGGI